MHIITFFSPRRGSGKTTSAMAVASAFLAAGKRVVVLDVTGGERQPTQLQDWEDRMVEAGHGMERIRVVPVDETCSLPQLLEDLEAGDADFVVVDAASEVTEAVADVLDQSTLIVVPATNYIRAALASATLSRYLHNPAHIVGLVTLNVDWETEQQVREGFLADVPVLGAALPFDDLFQRQASEGDSFRIASTSVAGKGACAATIAVAEELTVIAARAAKTPPKPLKRGLEDPANRAAMLSSLLDELAAGDHADTSDMDA